MEQEGAGERSSGRRWLWSVLKVAVVVVAAAAVVRIWLAPTPDVFAHGPSTLDEAIALSTRSGKPVVAVATSDFCAPCQYYKRHGLADPQVQAWIREHAVPFFVRIEWDVNDAKRLGRENGPVPATMLLAGGEIVDQFNGPADGPALLRWLEDRVASLDAAQP